MRFGQLIGVFSSIQAIQSPEKPFDCKNIHVNGYKYDLSAIDKDWKTEGADPLLFNPCKPLKHWDEVCVKGSYMCAMDRQDSLTSKFSFGRPLELFRNLKDELIIAYSNGSFDGNGFPFLSMIRFECDPRASEHLISEPHIIGGKFYLLIKGKAGCGRKIGFFGESFGTFTNILIFTTLAIVAYFTIGMLVNFFVYGERGLKILPNVGFWCEVADFMRDLYKNIKTNLFGGGGYQQI